MALVTNPPKPAATGDNGIFLNYHAGDSLSAKGITATRSGSAWQRDPTTGLWSQAGTNVWRDNHLPYSAARNARNFIGEPGGTNLCPRGCLYGTNGTTGWSKSGDAAATIGIVDDTTELAAAGLYNSGTPANGLITDGKAFKLDNSAGVATAQALIPLIGPPGVGAGSMYVFLRGGTGSILLDSSVGKVNFTAQPHYTKVVSRNFTFSGLPIAFRVQADPGQIVYFVLPQAEATTAETTPIPNSTSGTVSRAADRWATSFSYPPQSMTLYMRRVALPPFSVGNLRLFGIGQNSGAEQEFGLGIVSSGGVFANNYNAAPNNSGGCGAPAIGDDVRGASRIDSAGNAQAEQSINGAASTLDAKTATGPGFQAAFTHPTVNLGVSSSGSVMAEPICGSHLVIARATSLSLDQLEAL